MWKHRESRDQLGESNAVFQVRDNKGLQQRDGTRRRTVQRESTVTSASHWREGEEGRKGGRDREKERKGEGERRRKREREREGGR